VAADESRQPIALGLGVVGLAAPVAWLVVRPRLKEAALFIEGPVVLLLLSTLVFRIRDAQALATDPVDTAGAYRIACVGLAGVLGALAVTQPARADVGRSTSRPFRLYCLYIFVVALGAPLSIDPLLTAYRAVELAIGAVVVVGAYRVGGDDALRRLEVLFFWWLVALITTVWIGAAVAPGEAFFQIESPIPWQLHGVWPNVSANGTGTAGGMLAIWSIALLVSRRDVVPARRSYLILFVLLGLATLVFAQYRTGYVAVPLAIVVIALVRSRLLTTWLVIAAVLVSTAWGAYIVQGAEPVVLRGQSRANASQLSSRLYFWEQAIPVWEESPIIGKGLLTGTRFEVLAELGRTVTSSIHGTWIEALVGTGIIGIAVLALWFINLSARAFREAIRRGRLVPAVLLAFIFVRSLTGSTFEVFGAPAVLLLVFALSLPDGRHRQASLERAEVAAATPARPLDA
jgi:O-antigen ligase